AINRILALPGNRRLFLGHVLDLLNRTFNPTYLSRWTAHYGSLAGQNYAGGLDYVRQRAVSARNQLPRPIPFTLTSPAKSLVDASSVSLSGTAWIDIKNLVIRGTEPNLSVTWTTITNWRVSAPLILGTNQLEIVAQDFSGRPVVTNVVSITSTAV